MARGTPKSLLAGLLLAALAIALAVSSLADDAAQESEYPKWPRELGASIRENGKMRLDASEITEGYFIARSNKATSKRLKLRVTKDGSTLTYDLNGEGNNEVFPLQLGSGSYKIELYENVSGKKYAQAGKVTLSVSLTREDGAFLYPNQYVNYSPETEAVAAAAELCAGMTDKEAFQAVCDFMTKHFVYDFVKSVTVQAGTMPDIEGSWAKNMGICQDLSAIMVCMLRAQGIPSRLQIGWADKNYHAWTSSTVDGEEIFFDPTAAVNAIKAKEYTLERFY